MDYDKKRKNTLNNMFESMRFTLRSDEEVDEWETRKNLPVAPQVIPPRYRSATYETYQGGEEIKNFLRQGKPCILHGGNGTGKTHLAWATVRHLQSVGLSCRYIIAANFFDDVRQSFRDDSIVKQHEDLKQVQYLVIDEVDKRYGSPTEFNALFRLINHRYEWLRPTMLIGNQGGDKLQETLGPSVIDRIREDGKIIEITGRSARQGRIA